MEIATLTSAPFAARLGKEIIAEAADGELALQVFSVRENPLAAGPNAKRTPFSVVLRGPDTPTLADGHYPLRAEAPEGWRLEALYLNRIIPPASSDGGGAFYQVVCG